MLLFKTPRFFRWIFPKKTWGFSRSEKSVYLTFDDGPDPVATPVVLDLLKQNNIKATFFCVGENVLRHPELYQRIKDEGHTVGNHTMQHENGLKTTNKKYIDSVDKAATIIDSKLFRPPYGRIKKSQTNELVKRYNLIMWSWLSYDYDANIPVLKILSNAQKQIQAGDIIVLHDNKKSISRLKILLPEIIGIIEKKELAFKKMSSS
jgi:peptidoglycan/xylan/chitin deacetylase (PgdA/CDA1 family)